MVEHRQGGTCFLQAGSGDSLLLLHGIPGSAQAWAPAGQPLAEHFRVIIPDLRGFGRSDAPDAGYYMEAQAAALRELIMRLGITRLYMAGHDFGGPVALTLLRLYPELQVSGLVLSATNVFTDTYIPPPLRLARVPVLGTLFFKAAAGNRVGLHLMYAAACRNKAAVPWEAFRRHLTPAGMDLTRRIFQRSLADLKGNYEAVEAMLPGVKPPVLVLWGDRDPFFSTAVAERTCRAFPRATLKVYPETGHFVPEERPEEVARDITEFFRLHSPPERPSKPEPQSV